jgi:P-type Ca2+ transporter type 2C
LGNFHSVLRDGSYKELPALDLVPGDVVALQRGHVFCDMVILRGSNVLVDESALTGESIPVAKRELEASNDNAKYRPKRFASNSVFAGTVIQEADDGDIALVLSTGSFTDKGRLLTNVLSYERQGALFQHEIPVVLVLLMVETAVLVAVVIHWMFFDAVYAYFIGT